MSDKKGEANPSDSQKTLDLKKSVRIMGKPDENGPTSKPPGRSNLPSKVSGKSPMPGKRGSGQGLIKTNKVAPALVGAVLPVIDPGALSAAEAAKVREKRPAPKSAGPLTVMPSRAAFTGGIAVSKTRKPAPKKPSQGTVTGEPGSSASFDGINAAATHYHAPKNPQMYEAKMPKMPRYSVQNEPDSKSKPRTNPKSLVSLVETLKAIYGPGMQGASGKKKKKRKKKGDKTSDSDSDEQKDKKKMISDEGAEQLSTRLHGNQADVIQEFLQERRDCERDLDFVGAEIAGWVRGLWKVHFIYEFL